MKTGMMETRTWKSEHCSTIEILDQDTNMNMRGRDGPVNRSNSQQKESCPETGLVEKTRSQKVRMQAVKHGSTKSNHDVDEQSRMRSRSRPYGDPELGK